MERATFTEPEDDTDGEGDGGDGEETTDGTDGEGGDGDEGNLDYLNDVIIDDDDGTGTEGEGSGGQLIEIDETADSFSEEYKDQLRAQGFTEN